MRRAQLQGAALTGQQALPVLKNGLREKGLFLLVVASPFLAAANALSPHTLPRRIVAGRLALLVLTAVSSFLVVAALSFLTMARAPLHILPRIRNVLQEREIFFWVAVFFFPAAAKALP